MTESEYHPNLYVIRHGEADDDNRHLTDLGRRQIEAARVLLYADNGRQRTLILSSPQPRAVESARLIARGVYCFDEPADVVPWLDNRRCDRGEVNIPAELAARRHQDNQDGVHSLVLVMHEPDIIVLMRSLGPHRATVWPITLGSCWKLSTDPGEPHRRLEPAPIAA